MNQAQRRAQPIFKKMNAEVEELSVNQRCDLQCCERTVEKVMGPEPVPSLDIEFDEIQNELQRKMVEEIQCVICQQFPYKPLECKSCNKLFCKYCQLQLQAGSTTIQLNDQTLFDQEGRLLDPRFADLLENKSPGRDGRQMGKKIVKNQALNSNQEVCCPNCNARGDFLQEVNKVLRNCIDFCEFPHKCWIPGQGYQIIWKTLGELQAHAQFSCPKFGCDICYLEEFQHLTRAQLYDHIKRECPAVMIMCQICNKEYARAEFANHQCIKEFYIDKLNTHSYDVIDKLADKLILHRRQKEGLGLCSKYQCVEKHRNSGGKFQSMIAQNNEPVAAKCFRCKNVVNGYEDSYFCIYCNETYCPDCLGYCKYYDLDDMESLLLR